MLHRITESKQFRNLIIPLLLFICALVSRIINFHAIAGKLWINFLSDSAHYQMWALKLFKGTDTTGVFPMGPLYPFMIYILYTITATTSQTPILIFQAIIGSAAIIFIYFTAKQVFGEKPAIFSGIFALFYGPALFYDGLILSESLQYFLYAVLIFFLVKCFQRRKWYYCVCAGIITGLCTIGRTSVLIVILFIIILYLYKNLSRKALLHVGLIAGFSFLTILPATLHNLKQGDLVLISSNFGINFYIGNNENADGRYLEPKGLSLSEDFTGQKIAEMIQGKSLKPSQVSSFWSTLALKFVTKYPLRFVALTCLKFLRFFEGYEIHQAEDYYYARKFMPMLNICIIPFWIIAPLGLVAIFLTVKQKTASKLLLVFIVSYALSIIPFFILARYRLLIVPALLIGSGYTVFLFWEDFQKRRISIARIILIIVLFSFVFLPALSESRKTDKASAYVNHGLYYLYKNDIKKAEKYFNKALSVKKDYVKALNNLAGIFIVNNEIDDAIKTYNKSIAIDSTQGLPHLNLGRIYLQEGDIDIAKTEFKKAVVLAPFSIQAREYVNILLNKEITAYQAASMLHAQKKYREAIPLYELALLRTPDDIHVYNNFGYLLQAIGEYEKAISIYKECIKKFPNEPVPLNNLASIYFIVGDNKKAEELWIRSLKINPHQPDVIKSMQLLDKKR